MSGLMAKMAFFKKKKELTEDERRKKKEDSKYSAKRAMIKSVGANFIGLGASSALLNQFNKSVKHDPENFKKVKDYYKDKHGHRVHYDDETRTSAKPAHNYAGANNLGGSKDKSGYIFHDKSHHDPTMLAHEHGHVHPRGKLPIPAGFNLPSSTPAKVIGAGITAKMSNSKNKWVRRAGVALPLLSTIPHLYEEGRASVHAKRALNDIGVKKDVNKKLLMAHGAYSANSLIPAAASTYVNHKIKQRREKIMKEEEGKKNEQAS